MTATTHQRPRACSCPADLIDLLARAIDRMQAIAAEIATHEARTWSSTAERQTAEQFGFSLYGAHNDAEQLVAELVLIIHGSPHEVDRLKIVHPACSIVLGSTAYVVQPDEDVAHQVGRRFDNRYVMRLITANVAVVQ